MGYEAPGTGNQLDFTGTAHEGLEVTIDSVPTGLLLDIMESYEAIAAMTSSGKLDIAAAKPVIASLLDNFGDVLESWNVTKRGVPVPATPEGLRTLDFSFVMAIIGAWITGTAEPPEELGKGSPSGSPSPGDLTAMAALSSSLPS